MKLFIPSFTATRISTLLPVHVRNDLIRAASIDAGQGYDKVSQRRTEAVDRAIRRAKRECPNLFR